MANLLVDPNTLVAPDYTLEHYAESRLPLVEAGLTEEQAAAILTRIWTAGNEHDKQVWQERAIAEAQAARDQAFAAQEAANQRRELGQLEAEKARKDELKRNRDKYVPIPDRPPPSGPLVLAAPYATRRLEKGQYVELYYFTNHGLLAAAASITQVDDDALTLRADGDGTTSWVPAATVRSSKSVIPDSELSWKQFSEAVPRFIRAMEQAKWAGERVLMLARFWGNLQVHPFQQSCDPLDMRALLAYQAEQRQRWHQAIHAPNGAWNISILSEEILRETRDRVYRRDRALKDMESDMRLNALLGAHQGSTIRDGASAQHSTHSTSDGGAVRFKFTKRPMATPYPDRRQPFPDSAAGTVLPACAICLGRHQHRVFNCDATKTWDQAFDTIATRVDKNLVLIDNGRTLCCDWQRSDGCNSRLHDSRHLCSGCGQSTHGAQNCPRAEAAERC